MALQCCISSDRSWIGARTISLPALCSTTRTRRARAAAAKASPSSRRVQNRALRSADHRQIRWLGRLEAQAEAQRRALVVAQAGDVSRLTAIEQIGAQPGVVAH